MMIMISPEPDFGEIKKRLDDIGKGNSANAAMKKAINEMAVETKNRLHSETKSMYTIKALKKSDIKKESASVSRMQAEIKIRGRTLGLKKGYKTRKNGKRKAASATVRKENGSMREIKMESNGRTYKAFVAKMSSGHEGIFQRVPGKKMKKVKKGRTAAAEAIKEIISLSKAKAAEKAYDEKLSPVMQGELNLRMQKHIGAVLGG